MHKAKMWVAKQVRWTYRSGRTARSRGVRMVLGGLLVIALSILITLGAAPVPATSVTTDAGLSGNSGVLPLGAAGLQESRSSEELASGLTHTQIVRGEKSSKDFYTVDAALTITEKEGRQVADRLSDDGYNPEILTINRPPDLPGDSPLAYLVRAGKFDSKQEAEKLQERLKNSGYGGEKEDAYPTPAVTYTGYYGSETTGPWVVNVLEVDPNRFGGTLVSELATEVVPGKETVTDISDRTGSLAGVNGGYFVVEEEDGTPGDLAGISVVDGEPVSEAVNGRTSLILPTETGEGAYVATLSSEQIATASDGARRMVDGMNREPGLIRSCGGVGSMFREIQAKAPEYPTLPGAGDGMSWAAFSTAILVSAIGFTMWPHLFMKSYGADSERTIKKTIIIYPLYGYLLIPILIIGFAGILVFQDNPLDNQDNVLPELVVNVANFSPWLIGILLSGALAAAMSTGANLAHSASTVLVRDLFVAVFDRDMPEQRVVSLTKGFVVVLSVVAYLLALVNPASLVDLLLGAYGGVVQFFPLIVAVFFWKRATTAGAWAGLIAGSLVTLLFTFFVTTPFEIHAGIWGFIVNIVLLVGVSLATRPMPEEHVKRFVEGSKAPLEEIGEPQTSQPSA